MSLKFRPLKAEEIEARVGMMKDGSGLSLLLYQNARVGMQLLDETVGPFNWSREHREENGHIVCRLTVTDPETGRTVIREDVGNESNTDPVKGAYSDSFKRACVGIGIARELYTAPFIWIPADKAGLYTVGGRTRTNASFSVSGISYDGGRITWLEIVNAKTAQIVYTNGKRPDDAKPRLSIPDLQAVFRSAGIRPESFLKAYKIPSWEQVTEKKFMHAMRHREELKAWDEQQRQQEG